MCMGVALLVSELPVELIDQHQLTARLHQRGGEPEIRFLWRQANPVLPIWHQGQLRIVPWGNRLRRGRLPPTGWTWQETVESGGWSPWPAEKVDIPATFGLEKGVWFRIRQGIRGLLVRDDQGGEAVFVICQPANRYYRVMTRSDRMPVLIDATTMPG